MKLPFFRSKKSIIKKKKGFTFIEVMITAFLLGLFVTTLQGNLTNLFQLQRLANLETEVYEQAHNIFLYIQSGKGIATYLLNEPEKKRLKRRGADFSSTRGFLEPLAKFRFRKGERTIIFRRGVKLDNQPYRVRVERTVIEPSPFMFGLKIEMTNRHGKKAELKGIISYYDLLDT